MQVLLEQRGAEDRARAAGCGALVRELMDVRMTMASGGHVRLGADGYGEHDDLVIALALACWRAKWTRNQFGQIGLYWIIGEKSESRMIDSVSVSRLSCQRANSK